MKGWDWLALAVVIAMIIVAAMLINHTADIVINPYR